MKQQTLALAAEHHPFEKYRRPTRRERFLATMEQVVPRAELTALIEPHYRITGKGRPPVGTWAMRCWRGDRWGASW